MKRKWYRQITTFLLLAMMFLSLVACGGSQSEESQEPDTSRESNQQPVQPDVTNDENATEELDDTDLIEDQVNKLSLYKTISKYSGDGTLIQTVYCTYDNQTMTHTCIDANSSDYYVIGYDMFGRVVDEKAFTGGTLVEWLSYDKDGNYLTNMQYNEDGTVYMGYQWQLDGEGNKTKATNHSTNGDYTEDYYDSNGNEYEYIYYQKDGSIQHHTFHEFEYDDSGNVVVDHYIYIDGDTARNEYEYDTDGNIIAKTFYDSDGTATSRDEYEYDANGNQTKSVSYSRWADDDDLGHQRIYTYEYNAEGSVVRETYYVNGYMASETKYRDDGMLISELHYKSDGVIDYGYEWQYDANGNVTQVESYSNGITVAGETHEYEYGIDNEMLRAKVERYGGENMTIIWEYKYDDEGNLVHMEKTNDNTKEVVVVEYEVASFMPNNGNLLGGGSRFYAQLLE